MLPLGSGLTHPEVNSIVEGEGTLFERIHFFKFCIAKSASALTPKTSLIIDSVGLFFISRDRASIASCSIDIKLFNKVFSFCFLSP